MTESVTLPCPRCGAALPVDPTAPSVTCAYCRAVAPVPPAIREQAVAHAARVGAARDKADIAHRTIDTSQWAAGYYKNWWKVPVFFFGGMFTLWITAMVLRRHLEVPEGVLSWGSFVLVAGSLVVLMISYARYQTVRQKGGPLAEARSTCERCGAPLTFAAGSAAAVCRSCNATAVAGPSLQRDLASAAERRARDLEIEQGRAERSMYRAAVGHGTFSRRGTFLVMAIPVVLLAAIGVIGGLSTLISGLIEGRSTDVSNGLGFLAFGVFMVVAAGMVGAILYTKVLLPARAPGVPLRAIAARTGGHVVDDSTAAALDWLDAFWAGPAPYEVMLALQELARFTLVTTIDGLPAMLVVIRQSNPHLRAMHVVVAAPRERDGAVAVLPVAMDLQRRGFTVQANADGITLTRPDAPADLLTEPALENLLRRTAALARA